MTHDELSRQLEGLWHDSYKAPGYMALRAVVELHKPEITILGESTDGSYKETVSVCRKCSAYYPCPTIQAIEKELE